MVIKSGNKGGYIRNDLLVLCYSIWQNSIHVFRIYSCSVYIYGFQIILMPRSLQSISTWHPSGSSHITCPNQIPPFLTSALVFPDLGMSILFSSQLAKILCILLRLSGLGEMFPGAPSLSLISASNWSPFCPLYFMDPFRTNSHQAHIYWSCLSLRTSHCLPQLSHSSFSTDVPTSSLSSF